MVVKMIEFIPFIVSLNVKGLIVKMMKSGYEREKYI